jgi:tRNA-guanine family transglycosylase
MLGSRLATIHNLHYYHAFMREIRQVLENRQFPDFYEHWSPRLKAAYPDAYERGIKQKP